MIRRFVQCAFVLLGVSCMAVNAQSVPPYLDKDLAEIASLIEGRWDNDRHVFFADDAGLNQTRIADRQHIRITALEGGDESFSFKAERTVEGSDPIVLEHTFRINPATLGLEQVTKPLNPDGENSDRCVIDWHRQGGGFAGHARAGHCEWMFGPGEEGASTVATLNLSEKDFWIQTKSVDAHLRRARTFECWTAILRGAQHGDSGEGMSDWQFQRGVEIHDQGGEAELFTDEPDPRRIRLRLRNVDWPYGTNRPSLTLYVLEGDNDRAVSYAWNEGDAERIGLNLRWLQASCTYSPDES